MAEKMSSNPPGRSLRGEPVRAKALVTEPIVGLAPLGVREDLVRLGSLLELLLGLGIVAVHVRVELARELPERLLQLGVLGGTLDTEHLIGVAWHMLSLGTGLAPARNRVYAARMHRGMFGARLESGERRLCHGNRGRPGDRRDSGSQVLADYPDFSDVSKLKLNGDAEQAGDVLRLTSADNDETGTAFTKKAVLNKKKSFKTEFNFSMHDSSGTPGDGMAFFIHSSGKGEIGDGGGGLGYGSIGDSLAVEFDTFDNGGNDEDANEVGIIQTGRPARQRTHRSRASPCTGVRAGSGSLTRRSLRR